MTLTMNLLSKHSLTGKSLMNQQFLRVAAILAVVILLSVIFGGHAFAATTGTEFQATSTKLSGLVTGYYGKAVAFFALMIGAGYAAYKKDLGAMVAPIILTLGISIIIGIINTSFTAVI